uniref:F-box domain-containing protein n=1 Tax=Bionectria ochroleuca TaxID=29856 RepID=A0A8H7N798_BIOOC
MALDFPNEIWNQIMGFLIPVVPRTQRESGIRDYRSLRPRDLSSLCLVSQRFRHIAQPLLYHTINITDETAMTEYPHSHKWPAFLLRTIAKQPHLAKCIRVLVLSDMIILHESPSIGFPWDVPRSIRCALETALAYQGSNVLPIALLLYATMVEKIIFFPADVDGIQVP